MLYLTLSLCVSLAAFKVTSSWAHVHLLPEHEQMALEGSSQLLTPLELSTKLRSELSLIRRQFPIVVKNNITHIPLWVPGQLLSSQISDEQMSQLNASDYGPFIKLEHIDIQPIATITVMTFGKPYNPEVLGDIVLNEFGVRTSPNSIYHEGNDVNYEDESNGKLKYIFRRGPKKCLRDCDDRYWEFSVDEDDKVTLLKEYTSSSYGKLVD